MIVIDVRFMEIDEGLFFELSNNETGELVMIDSGMEWEETEIYPDDVTDAILQAFPELDGVGFTVKHRGTKHMEEES